MVNMAVHHVIRAILPEYVHQIAYITPRSCMGEAVDYSRSECRNFVVIGTGLRSVDHEIHMKKLSVRMAKEMHQPCLHASSIHTSYYVEDTDTAVRCITHLTVASLLSLCNACMLIKALPVNCTRTAINIARTAPNIPLPGISQKHARAEDSDTDAISGICT